MFTIFGEEKIITVIMLLLLAASILLRILPGAVYRRMIRETENMAATENKLLKQCKVKFTNCYQLNNGMANIPVFVDKFLNRMTLGPFSFDALYYLSGQVLLLSIVTAGIGICKSIVNGKGFLEILPFYIVSLLALYIFFSISGIVDVKGKRRILKVNLVDYLENHLSPRIRVTEQDIEKLYGKRTVELMPIGGNMTVLQENVRKEEAAVGEDTVVKENNKAVKNMEELDVLLEEFLLV